MLKNDRGWYLVVFIYLMPTLFFGYTADDRQYVLTNLLMSSDASLWSHIVATISRSERFFPLHQVLYVVSFHFFSYENAWAYHLVLLLLNMGAIFTFVQWVKGTFQKCATSWLVLLFLLATQFRITYSDPIISYFGMMQIFSIAFFFGLISLEKYVSTSQRKHLFCWFVLVLIQLLIYELTIFLIPVTLIVLYEHRKTSLQQVWSCVYVLVLALTLYLVMVYSFKQSSSTEYSGTKLSLDIWLILRTSLFEMLGSMPFSYGAYLASEKLRLPVLYVWGSYLAGLIAFIYLTTLKVNFLSNRFLSRKFFYGISIWICSAASIAFSGRYQQEIVPGLTYLVVYLQNFGFALCLASIVNINSRISKTVIVSAVLATFAMNLLVINEGLKVDGAKKIVVQALLSRDLLEHYRFDQCIFNEKILQEDEFFERNINKNLGSPIYAKLSEIKNLKIKSNLTTGIILASAEPYSSAFVLIGKYNAGFGHIESVTLLTSSKQRAEGLLKIYRGSTIKTFSSNGNILFGFELQDFIAIPNQLNGVFR